MTDLAYCPQGGWLVSRYPLPEDPADHWTWGVGADIGCNHLVCSGCGEAVRDARLSPKRGSLTKKLKEMALDSGAATGDGRDAPERAGLTTPRPLRGPGARRGPCA